MNSSKRKYRKGKGRPRGSKNRKPSRKGKTSKRKSRKGKGRPRGSKNRKSSRKGKTSKRKSRKGKGRPRGSKNRKSRKNSARKSPRKPRKCSAKKSPRKVPKTCSVKGKSKSKKSEDFTIVPFNKKLISRLSKTEKAAFEDGVIKLQKVLLRKGYYAFIRVTYQDENLLTYNQDKIYKILNQEAEKRKKVCTKAAEKAKKGKYNHDVFVQIIIPTRKGEIVPSSRCYMEIYTMQCKSTFGNYFPKEVKIIEKIARESVNGYINKNHSFSIRKKNT